MLPCFNVIHIILCSELYIMDYWWSRLMNLSLWINIWILYKYFKITWYNICCNVVSLKLLGHNEEYTFTLPSAYARSILTVPWVELGDRIMVQCQKTGYTAGLTFHTKPFYGGKLHRVSSEIKNPAGEIFCKAHGEWNGKMEFTFTNVSKGNDMCTSSLNSLMSERYF